MNKSTIEQIGNITRDNISESIPFTQIPNSLSQNINLSWKARGLYVYLISLPPNWDIYKRELAARAVDGYRSMNSGWNELVKAGYITSVQIKNESGKFVRWNHHVHINPTKTEENEIEYESPFLNI